MIDWPPNSILGSQVPDMPAVLYIVKKPFRGKKLAAAIRRFFKTRLSFAIRQEYRIRSIDHIPKRVLFQEGPKKGRAF
jgi:hypothetical protein